MITDIDLTDETTIEPYSSQDSSNFGHVANPGDINNQVMIDDPNYPANEYNPSLSDGGTGTPLSCPNDIIPEPVSEDIPAHDVTAVPHGNIGESPYSSGFDDEHPMPSYKELRNAGFTDFEAKKILYGTHEIYSDKELFECLYGSDNPKEAYDAMIREKTAEMQRRIDTLISDI